MIGLLQILFLLLGVVGIGGGVMALIGKSSSNDTLEKVDTDRYMDEDEKKSEKAKLEREIDQLGRIGKGALVAGIIFFVLSWLITALVTIGAGEVGIVTRFGAVTGRELGPGISVKLPTPLESVVKFDTRVQKEEAEANAASNDLQDVFANVSVNYHLNRGDVSQLYQKVGKDFDEKLMAPAIQETFKSTTAKFTAQDLIRQRAEVKNSVTEDLSARLKEYGIVVDSVNLVNFRFSNEFTQAIEESQVAAQKVVKAQNEVERVKKEAEAAIEEAKGRAEAQRQQAQTITPEYLQLKAIEKWDGKYPSTVVGGNSVPLVQLPQR